MLLHKKSQQFTNQLVISLVLQVIITKIVTPEEVRKRGFTCRRIGEHEVNAINKNMEEGRRWIRDVYNNVWKVDFQYVLKAAEIGHLLVNYKDFLLSFLKLIIECYQSEWGDIHNSQTLRNGNMRRADNGKENTIHRHVIFCKDNIHSFNVYFKK